MSAADATDDDKEDDAGEDADEEDDDDGLLIEGILGTLLSNGVSSSSVSELIPIAVAVGG